jgi:glycogen debranching enzyme
MVQGINATVIDFTFTGYVKSAACLEMRPLIAFRSFHSTTHENGSINRAIEPHGEILELHPYAGLPKLYIYRDSGEIAMEKYWYRNFEFERERERGLDDSEALFSPFGLRATFNAANQFRLIISTDRDCLSQANEFQPIGQGLPACRRHVNLRSVCLRKRQTCVW